MINTMKSTFNVSKVKILPIVVGCRGAIPDYTIQALRELKICRKDSITISLTALRCSILMAFDHVNN